MADPQSKIILTVIKGPEQGKIFEFTEQDTFLLGRDAPGSKAHCRLSSEDRYVSRNHFLLEINPPDCYLRDIASLNGTFVVRKNSREILFLEGRPRTEWESRGKYLARLYQCCSYQKTNERIKLQNDDLISVGRTALEVKIAQYIPEVEPQRATTCIRCGKNITDTIRGKEIKKVVPANLLCDECQSKEKIVQKISQKESINCWGCNKDLTAVANADGRAGELRDIGLYWCEACAFSRQGEVPVSKIANYRILDKLGAGSFGIVFLAWHEPVGRIVALKVTKEKVKRNKQLLQRFKREIAIMKELRHPHLVRLYDEGMTEEDNYYFVSEYLPERSLADHLREKHDGKIPYEYACYLISQALNGLSYFHNFGQKHVHRDLKPENIFLRKDEKGMHVAKIGDFGLARSYILHGGTISGEGEWAGTIFYCPPEQISNFKNVKPGTDIYAMGVTLYHVITGEFPYHYPSRREQLEMISKGKKPRDPVDIILGNDKPMPIQEKVQNIPKDLAAAINKAIEKEASKRFQVAEEFNKSIARYAKWR